MNETCKFCLAREVYGGFDECEPCLAYIQTLSREGGDGLRYARQLTNQANCRRVERMAG